MTTARHLYIVQYYTVRSRNGQQAKTYTRLFKEPHVAGMLLVKELLARFRICILINPPQDSVKGPDSLFVVRYKKESLVRLLHSIGRLPLRLLSVKLTSYKLFMPAQEAGNVPVNWLLVIIKCPSRVMLLQDSGSVPLMLHSSKTRYVSCMPIQAFGRGPLRVSALYTPKAVRFVMVPQEAGKLPVSLVGGFPQGHHRRMCSAGSNCIMC